MSQEILVVSPDGQEILTVARGEAERLGHGHIGPEHLILAITAQPDGSAAAVIASAGIDVQGLRDSVDSVVGPPRTSSAEPSTLRYTDRAKKTFGFARQSADELGDAEVGGVHLLLGLLREGENVAALALADKDLTVAKAIDAVLRKR